MLLGMCLVIITVNGQGNVNELIPYCDEGAWGYMNKEKEVIIPAAFDEVHFFDLRLGKQSMARVKKSNKYGVIDKNGKLIIPIKFDSIGRYSIATTRGSYGEIFQNGKHRYFKANGKIRKKLKGERVRTWGCGFGMIDHCIGYKTIKNLAFVDTKGEVNYEYREIVTHEKGRTRTARIDTVQVDLDSIVCPTYSNVKILYRNDGKINVCRLRPGKKKRLNLFCLGYKYDEVEYIVCNPTVISGIYEPIIKVREGNNWGLIDLSVLQSDRIRADYKTSWEYVKPSYFNIIAKKYDYIFVEYEEGKFGYIKPLGAGKVTEYWIKK